MQYTFCLCVLLCYGAFAVPNSNAQTTTVEWRNNVIQQLYTQLTNAVSSWEQPPQLFVHNFSNEEMGTGGAYYWIYKKNGNRYPNMSCFECVDKGIYDKSYESCKEDIASWQVHISTFIRDSVWEWTQDTTTYKELMSFLVAHELCHHYFNKSSTLKLTDIQFSDYTGCDMQADLAAAMLCYQCGYSLSVEKLKNIMEPLYSLIRKSINNPNVGNTRTHSYLKLSERETIADTLKKAINSVAPSDAVGNFLLMVGQYQPAAACLTNVTRYYNSAALYNNIGAAYTQALLKSKYLGNLSDPYYWMEYPIVFDGGYRLKRDFGTEVSTRNPLADTALFYLRRAKADALYDSTAPMLNIAIIYTLLKDKEKALTTVADIETAIKNNPNCYAAKNTMQLEFLKKVIQYSSNNNEDFKSNMIAYLSTINGNDVAKNNLMVLQKGKSALPAPTKMDVDSWVLQYGTTSLNSIPSLLAQTSADTLQYGITGNGNVVYQYSLHPDKGNNTGLITITNGSNQIKYSIITVYGEGESFVSNNKQLTPGMSFNAVKTIIGKEPDARINLTNGIRFRWGNDSGGNKGDYGTIDNTFSGIIATFDTNNNAVSFTIYKGESK